MTTTRVAALARILDLLKAHPNIAGARPAVRLLEHEAAELRVGVELVHGGDIRSLAVEPEGHVGRPNPLELSDRFAVDLWVVVTRPGAKATEARRRSAALIDAVVDTVRAHPTLARDTDPDPLLVGVAAAWPSSIDGPNCGLAQEGYLGLGRVEVTVLAHRLTAHPTP